MSGYLDLATYDDTTTKNAYYGRNVPRGAPQSPQPMTHKGPVADEATSAALLERRRRAAQEGGGGRGAAAPLPDALANPPGAAYLELYVGHRGGLSNSLMLKTPLTPASALIVGMNDLP